MTEIDQLRAALIAAQKLEKKLRQLANRGDCLPEDVEAAKQAVAWIRQIYERHGLAATDIDFGANPEKK